MDKLSVKYWGQLSTEKNLTIIKKQQKQTILGQAEKLSQQQTIIQQQNILITTQQKQLNKNKQELSWLNGLRYQLKEIKKMMYGIKSEKRHQFPSQGKAGAECLRFTLKPYFRNHLLCFDINDFGFCSLRLFSFPLLLRPDDRDIPASEFIITQHRNKLMQIQFIEPAQS